MPSIVAKTLSWVHVDRTRIYAVGGSMGGQETLLLLGRHPHLLAGAAAFDAVTDLALQYRDFPQLACKGKCAKTLGHQSFGRRLQELAQTEIGGTPTSRPSAFAERSPLTYAAAIARSCVPLQLWWSMKDKIVLDQSQQTGALYSRLDQLNPDAPVTAFIGTWRHSAEMRASTRLPAALAAFGLLPAVAHPKTGLHEIVPPDPSGCATAP
jgi:pimeloyl-ACP methyl ester carboxylesterase